MWVENAWEVPVLADLFVKPLKLMVASAFWLVVWVLTLIDNTYRKLTNMSIRSEYNPVFGRTYRRVLDWAMEPSQA
jgi:hypothetical protein